MQALQVGTAVFKVMIVLISQWYNILIVYIIYILLCSQNTVWNVLFA